jgi:hypothetical protein
MGKKGKKKLENGIFQQKRRDFEQFSENAIFENLKIFKNRFFYKSGEALLRPS